MGWSAIATTKPRDADVWILSVSWLANPAIWVGMIATALGRWKVAAVAGACASVLCLLALSRFAAIVSKYPGYWLWAATAGFLLATSALLIYREK